jgi:predicted ribosome-associated RNA-binding protein Tma20
MSDLLEFLKQPMPVTLTVFALLGAIAVVRSIWSFATDHLGPLLFQAYLERRKLVLPFADKVLDRRTTVGAEIFRHGGPKYIDFARDTIYLRHEVHQLRELLSSMRFIHICGPPSSGKSVISLNVAYLELQDNHTVLYFNRPSQLLTRFAEHLQTPLARRLDRGATLIIVDDVHLDLPLAAHFFTYVYTRLSRVRLLFVSRPIDSSVLFEEEQQLFPFTKYMRRLDVSADTTAGPLVDFYTKKRFGKPMPPATKQQFLQEVANDLLILGQFLAAWNGSPTVNIPNIREAVFCNVREGLVRLKRVTPHAVSVIFILGVFYRFEVLVDVVLLRELQLDFLPLVRSGDVLFNNDYALLHHSSSARLYSNAIQQGKMQEYFLLQERLGRLPLALFSKYVSLRPRNFCALVAGLRNAPDLLRDLLKNEQLHPMIRDCLESETELPLLGRAQLIMFANSKGVAWQILEPIELRRNAHQSVEQADSNELSLFLFHMSRVSHTKAREWLAAVPTSLIAEKLRLLTLRGLAGALFRLKIFSPEATNEIIDHIGAAVICEKFLEDEDLEHLRPTLARLCRVLEGRVLLKSHAQRDFVGEWSTKVVFYCDNKKAVRFLSGRVWEMPFSASKRQYYKYSEHLVRSAKSDTRIIVDEGAAAAIGARKSLFPVGVVDVQGTFEEGAVVQVLDSKGVLLAAGVTNYSSSVLSQIRRKRTEDIAKLGFAPNRVFDNDHIARLESLSRLGEIYGEGDRGSAHNEVGVAGEANP